MTLDHYLEALRTELAPLRQEWFVTDEGWIRAFVAGGLVNGTEMQTDWPLTALARVRGRNYLIAESAKAAAFVGLSQMDMVALKEADQNHPERQLLRQAVLDALGLTQTLAAEARADAEAAKLKAASDDLKAPWQRDPNVEHDAWKQYVGKKGGI